LLGEIFVRQREAPPLARYRRADAGGSAKAGVRFAADSAIGAVLDAGPENIEVPDLLAEVNARVRELADSQSGGTDEWDFRRECGEPDCDEAVSLTVAKYELLRASHSPIPGRRSGAMPLPRRAGGVT
jgi:hypothetical protein